MQSNRAADCTRAPEPKVSCRGKQTAAPKLPASKKKRERKRISQYCLCCALNSNVKQAPPAPPDGGLHLHSGPLQTLLEGHLALLARLDLAAGEEGRRGFTWLQL